VLRPYTEASLEALAFVFSVLGLAVGTGQGRRKYGAGMGALRQRYR
jgi:hypothetical protein